MKTQLKAIFVDQQNRISQISSYQAPQIITPPVTIIEPQTGLNNDTQTIKFVTNRPLSVIYYTVDGSNPENSNTTKTVTPNTILTINKTTTLKYYTQDNDGYTSTTYNYNTPQHSQERPIITIYNTTRIYNDGTQRIMIQSNQPGFIWYITSTNNTSGQKRVYLDEITINNNEVLEIYSYSSSNSKYSNMVEYTNGSNKTIIKYNYKIFLYKQPRYIGINSFDYNLIDTSTINGYLYYNPIIQNMSLISSVNNNLKGITIYNTLANTVITVNDKVYGDLNHVSILYNTFDGMEIITIMNNNKTLYTLYVSYDKFISYNSEIITTFFKINQDIISISRNEIISHSSSSNNNDFEVVQSYLLTNQIVTHEILEEWINKNNSYNVGMQKAAYGTALTALSTLYFNDMITAYYAYYFNITYSRQNDIIILTGVNINELTYTTTNDPTTGNVIYDGTKANKFYFRLMTTISLSECERIAIQSSEQDTNSGILNFYKDLIQFKDLTFTYDNDTYIMNITTPNSDYYIELDMLTGVSRVFLNSKLTYGELNISEIFKGAYGTIGEGGCYHDQKTNNTLNNDIELREVIVKAHSNVTNDLLNSISSELENFLIDGVGGMMVSGGLMITLSSGGPGIIIGGPMMMIGATLCFYAAGARSIDDLQNPEIYTSACTSILLASVGGLELKTAVNAAKLAVKTTIKDKVKTVIVASLDQNGFNSNKGIIYNYIEGKIREYGIGFIYDKLGYDGNEN